VPITSEVSANEIPTVALSYEDDELRSVAERIRVELRSGGYQSITVNAERNSPACNPQAELGDHAPVVDIVVRVAGEEALAEICVRSRPGMLAAAIVEGNHADEGHFAIRVSEALHGLLLSPQPRVDGEQVVVGEALAPIPKQDSTKAAALSLTFAPQLVVDVPTGGTWAGALAAFQFAFFEDWGFRGEIFSSVRPRPYSDEEIDLKSHLLWTRWGAFGNRTLGFFRMGWRISAGPFFNVATAEAVAPRVGGSDARFGAILHASSYAEFPSHGTLFIRPTLGVSTLIPRLRYQMSQTVTPEVGEFLLEAGLEFGLRFHP